MATETRNSEARQTCIQAAKVLGVSVSRLSKRLADGWGVLLLLRPEQLSDAARAKLANVREHIDRMSSGEESGSLEQQLRGMNDEELLEGAQSLWELVNHVLSKDD